MYARAQPSERDKYVRGRVESRFVSAASSAETRDADVVDELLQSYYEYRVCRHVRSYILSCSNDTSSLRKLIRTIVRLGFSILLSRSREEAQAAERTIVMTEFSCRRIGSQPLSEASSSGFALSRAPIGRDIALGSSPAETVWTLTIDVELTMSQSTTLRQRPDIVDCIMRALERAVPLNLDYVLRFKVGKDDYTMKLMRADEADWEAGLAPPVIGLNTALGKVKKRGS